MISVQPSTPLQTPHHASSYLVVCLQTHADMCLLVLHLCLMLHIDRCAIPAANFQIRMWHCKFMRQGLPMLGPCSTPELS